MVHLTSSKKGTESGYKNAFFRNIAERTDQPVFSVQEAVAQLHVNYNNHAEEIRNFQHWNYLEVQMDSFYIKHLPEDIVSLKYYQQKSAQAKPIKVDMYKRINTLAYRQKKKTINNEDYVVCKNENPTLSLDIRNMLKKRNTLTQDPPYKKRFKSEANFEIVDNSSTYINIISQNTQKKGGLSIKQRENEIMFLKDSLGRRKNA